MSGCQFCHNKEPLLPVQISGNIQFCENGRVLWYCSICGSIDNSQLRDTRYLRYAVIEQNCLFNRHQRKKVIAEMCWSSGYKSVEETKLKIVQLNNEVRHLSDSGCVSTLSKEFHISEQKLFEKLVQLLLKSSKFYTYEVSQKIL